jgi:hypothetical protein
MNQTIERLATGVFKNKRLLSVVLRKNEGAKRPCGIQIVPERIFVVYLLEAFRCGP